MTDLARSMVTQGALDTIYNHPERIEQSFPVPICQCLQIKMLEGQGGGAPERIRIVLSDIKNFVQSMLATQANYVVREGKLKKGSFVRLKSYQITPFKGKRILVILDLEVIESLGELGKLGTPESLGVKDEVVKEEVDVKPVTAAITGSGFYGNRPQQPAAQDRALPSRTGPSSSQSHAIIYPIEAISPFMNNWTIKARVTKKSDIRTWHKASGEGKLFSVELLDDSGEIKATGFNEQCDQLYDTLEEGQVYYISHCRAAPAKKQFNTTTHDYELTFERNSMIEKAEHEEGIPQIRFNFTAISALEEIEKDSTVDIIGVLKEVADVDQIISKSTQKPYQKRDLTMVDDTGYSIKLTIWGKLATSFEANTESVVAFKGAKVNDFGGRSLSLLSSGSMTINPDIEEAHKLKGWYDAQGRTDHFNSFTASNAGAAGGRQDPLKTIAAVKDEGLGMNEKEDYFSVKGTIAVVKQTSFAYPACPTAKCNNKKVHEMDGSWRCEHCELNHERPEYRYVLSLNVQDHTGQIYLSAFDDVGRLIMGTSANDVTTLKEENPQAAERVFEDAGCKTFTFKCRAKMDTYGDIPRARYQIQAAFPVNFTQEANALAELIKSYSID